MEFVQMSHLEIKETVEQIALDVKQMQAKNDERLDAVEKGLSTPLENEALTKANAQIDALDEKLVELQKQMARPNAGGVDSHDAEAAAEQKAAFDDFLRTGEKGKLKALLAKAGSTTTNGWNNAVPQDVSQTIEKRLGAESTVRDLVTFETRGSTDITDLIDVGGSTVGWRGEGAAVTETGTATLSPVSYTGGMLYALPKVTEESLDDLFFNVANKVIGDATDGFIEQESSMVINGDGVDKPTGFLASTFSALGDATRTFGQLQAINTGVAAALPTTADIFIDLEAELHERYERNAKYLMHKKTLATVRKLKGSDGHYVFQPAMPDGTPATINGFEYETSSDMPVQAAGAKVIAFGDFKKAYKMFPIVGLKVDRDDVTSKGNVLFYVRRRLYGGVYDPRAVKFINCAL